MEIVLVAQESAGVHALRMLIASDHRLVAVLTGDERGDAGRGVTVGAVARELGVPVQPAEQVREAGLAEQLREQRVDVLLNVHSLYLIAPEVLAAPRVGAFNLHPGPLPGYAGLNASSWAIWHGESRHGVTLHWIEPGIDAGAVAYRTTFPITATDTGLSVSLQCVRHGLPLLETLLGDLSHDRCAVPSIPQDLTQRRYFGRAVPNGGWVPWHLPASRVADFVRACDYAPLPSPWGHPRSAHPNGEIAVVRVAVTGEPAGEPPGTVGASEGDAVRVAAADDWVLVRRVRIDGGPSRPPADVLRTGTRLVDLRHAPVE